MIDLEWWQVVIGIVTGLGLSAAPWIAALLRGGSEKGLVTASIMQQALAQRDKAYDDMVAEKNTQIARAEADRNAQREGMEIERKRGDGAFRETIALAREFGATTVHLLRALPNVQDEDGKPDA